MATQHLDYSQTPRIRLHDLPWRRILLTVFVAYSLAYGLLRETGQITHSWGIPPFCRVQTAPYLGHMWDTSSPVLAKLFLPAIVIEQAVRDICHPGSP